MATNPSIPNAAMPVVGPGNLCTVPWFQFFSFLKSAATNINLPLSTLNGGTGKTQYSDGQLLIGDSLSGSLDLNTLTAGPGVTITNGHGNITISAETFTGVISTGSPAPGQSVIWTGANAISSGTITTPIIDPNSSPGSPGGDGVNVLFSGDLSSFTGGMYAFDDESKFSNFTSPYYSFSCFTTFTGTDVAAAKRLFGFNSNPTYSGTATGGSGSLCQALNFTAIFSGTGTLDELNGCAGGATIHSGTVTNGICYSAGLNALGGTFTNGFGYYAFNNINGGTVTQWYSFFDATDEGPSAAGTSHGFYQQATNHPNFWGSTSEFSLATKHDYLTASSIVGTDASKNLTSLAIPLTVANGGTGNATLTAHGVLIGEGTSAVAVTGAGTSGQVLTSNGASADPTFQTPASSAMTLISKVTTSGSQTSVTFSSIPGTYTHLEVMIYGRSQQSAGSDDTVTQFNGDTGNNYATQAVQGQSTTALAVENNAVSGLFMGNLPGATATANFSGSVEFKILGYATTTFFKTSTGINVQPGGSGPAGINIYARGSQWSSTAAITSMKIFLNSGAAFVNGSIICLYGIS